MILTLFHWFAHPNFIQWIANTAQSIASNAIDRCSSLSGESSNGWVARGISTLLNILLAIELWLQICVWLCWIFLTISFIFLCNFPWMWFSNGAVEIRTRLPMHWKNGHHYHVFLVDFMVFGLTNYAFLLVFFLLRKNNIGWKGHPFTHRIASVLLLKPITFSPFGSENWTFLTQVSGARI